MMISSEQNKTTLKGQYLRAAQELIETLIQQEFIPEEDIAWISVNQDFINAFEATRTCPVRNVQYVKIAFAQLNFLAIEFRYSPWAKNSFTAEGLRGQLVWNITKRTKHFFFN